MIILVFVKTFSEHPLANFNKSTDGLIILIVLGPS